MGVIHLVADRHFNRYLQLRKQVPTVVKTFTTVEERDTIAEKHHRIYTSSMSRRDERIGNTEVDQIVPDLPPLTNVIPGR